MGHPKTGLEFIKDVIDSLASYKEIAACSVASNKDIYCKFIWKKIDKIA